MGVGDRRRSAMTDDTTLRRCIGSTRFGIEAHEAPVTEFPAQPSQKDGLGRMCKPHWNEYTAGLARDAKARKAAEAGAAEEPDPRSEPGHASTLKHASRKSKSKGSPAAEPEVTEAHPAAD